MIQMDAPVRAHADATKYERCPCVVGLNCGTFIWNNSLMTSICRTRWGRENIPR